MGTSLKLDKRNVPVGETSETIVQGLDEASSSEIKQYEHNVPIGETSEIIVQDREEASSSEIKQYEITELREGFEQKNTAGVDAPDNDIGCLKMNVNGCIREKTNKAGFGGVIKDAKGAWLLGFYGKFRPCTGLEAEIWSIYRGITIAFHRYLTNVEIASNCAMAVRIFQGSLDGPSSMVNEIRDGIHLMQRVNGRIKHVPREANEAAEAMANQGVEQDVELKVMNNPPEAVKGLLINDLTGIDPDSQGSGDSTPDGLNLGFLNSHSDMATYGGTDPALSVKLAKSLKERLSRLPRETQPSYYSIFRVPEKLGQLNNKVHTPHLVSIGPLHHGEPELIGMEDCKLRFLQSYLGRTRLSLESCFTLIQEFIQVARNRYSTEIVEVTATDEFVTMVLVDSCFVIESMIRYLEHPAEGGNFHFVRSDMILVGNQLPFFVLDRIYDFALTFGHRNAYKNYPTFLELSADYFETILLISGPPDTTGIKKDGVKHLLDLVRLLHLPSERLSSTEHSYTHIPTASLLREAGMKFECGRSRPYLDLNYNPKGVLEIPQLLLNNRADLLLINMIALEVNSYLDDSYILDFVVFMDDLISTGKDVDILVESGIIRNYIGESQDIADKFNRLSSHSVLGNYYFGNIASDVNSYYKDRHNQWRATLKRDYCGSPFKVASVVAATILLVLTFMQTLGTIFGLPKKFAFMLLWVTAGSFLSIFGAVVVMNYYSVLLRRMRLRRRRPLPGSP